MIQIKLEITLLTGGRIEVVITAASADYTIRNEVEAVVSKIAEAWPLAVVRIVRAETEAVELCPTAGKRGGPVGTPESQKQWIVKGWLKVQGRISQQAYAHSHGVSCSTLRRWTRELRMNGKL
ncbi:MAG TPA: hypothetical protein VLG46_17395 [Anaerolineae bacterium]|nr:hypothetical protein [Anaerolineae bacterium]